MKRKYLLLGGIGFICLVAILLVLRYSFYNGLIRLNYPSHTRYPIRGMDISHHQGRINWDKVDRAQVRFVFMKATEGENHRDSLYVVNHRQAKTQGIATGAYHFFTFCKSGTVQARNYMSNVSLDSTDMPPVIDLEYGGNCKKENRFDDMVKEIGDFIGAVEGHYRKRVLIYTTNEFYNDYLLNLFPDNPVWIRDIVSKPKLKDNRLWTFWQYTNRGSIEGIGKPVDLNVFYGNEREFARYRQDTLLNIVASSEAQDK